ncbi:MAG: photosynthetic complex assembly protein PuhC [Pseudomonadota bacterium]
MEHRDTAKTSDPAIIPKPLLSAVIALLVLILAVVTIARLTGYPVAARAPEGDILQERILYFSGALDGSAYVKDRNGDAIADFEAGEAVFISTIARVMERERMKIQADPEEHYILRLREGDRLALYDPVTDRETELMSFGSDNVAAFMALLDPPDM